MSFGSFLRGIVAQVNPFDHGATYSTYNPQRKRPEDYQPQIITPTADPGLQTNGLSNRIGTNRTPIGFGTLHVANTVSVPQQKQYQTTVQKPVAPQPMPLPKPNVTAQTIANIGADTTLNHAVGPQWTNKTKPGYAKTIDTGASISANVASGAGEGILKLIGAPLSIASLVNRKTGHTKTADFIDRINVPSRIGDSIAGARKQVDVAAQKEGINTPYQVGSRAISTALVVPATAELLSNVSRIPKVAKALPKTTNVVRKVSKYAGGELLPKVRKVLRGNPAEDQLVEASGTGEVANTAAQTPAPAPVPQRIPVSSVSDIPVAAGDTGTVNVPVRRTPSKLIQEVSGDASHATSAEQKVADANKKAMERFQQQVATTNDTPKISDVTPRQPGDAGYVTAADIRAERDALDQALANKEITKAQHAAATKALDETTPVDATPDGKKIEVKQVNPIDVNKVEDVPVNLPETPGKVRLTTAADPVKAQSEAIATQVPPAPLPKVGATMPDGTVVTKRMVQAARNQRKLAKQYAKTKGDTKNVMAAIPELAPKPEGNPGFVKTGEFAKGKQGNAYQTVNREAEAAQAAHDAANLSAKDILSQSEQEMMQTEQRTAETVRNLKAKIEDPNFPKNTPEGKAILNEYRDAITRYAQGLALADRTVRRTSTGDQIANRFVNKLIVMAHDASKLSDAHVAQVQQAENAFTDARDAANALAERFKATGSPEDFAAWRQAQQAAEQADRQSRITEYHVAKEVLGKNKNATAVEALRKIEQDAGVYSMDAIDANMLSGTGTMVRNYINTLFPRAEAKAFGKVSAAIVRPLGDVGGYSHEGAKIGSKIGRVTFKADQAARKEGGVGFIRRTVTAGNTLGEHNIQATAYAKGYDHYKQVLAKDGYTGTELNNRAEFMTRTDPDGLVKQYEADALQANALSSLTHSKKVENWLADSLQKKLADSGFGHTSQVVARGAAKSVTRVGLGFPTVIARSLAEGLKRATLGIPEAGFSTLKYLKTGDKQVLAQDLSKAIQHAGSGAAVLTMGYALGKMGVVSGAYPSDKQERDRWEQTGRQPNSIHIAGQWFNIPGYMGGFALPLMLGASLANGNIKDEATLKNVWSNILDASPVDNIQSTLEILTGNASDAKIKNAVTSIARTLTPAGAFLNEMAKLIDNTKNDTTTKSAIMNILDNIAGGIPVVNNLENKTPKTDSQGNVLHNPNPLATVLGAQGSDQPQGQQDVQQAQKDANATYKQLKDNGVLDNKHLMSLVDKKLQAQIARGQDLTPEQVKDIQKSVTKGVGTGIEAKSDSNWRQTGDYATDRTVMQVKLEMLKNDPLAKPSDIDNLNVQIARDNVLEQNQVPYDDLKLYEDTSQTEWRAMGDNTNDAYNPETYQRLAELDKLLTDAGGSYNSDPTKNKFTPKGAGKGKKGKKIGTSFGTLSTSDNSFGPKVRKYNIANLGATSNIPVINVQRPNIVHKISVSG